MVSKKFKKLIAAIFFMLLIFLIFNLVLRTMYPVNYKDYISKYSKTYNLDPRLVSAIIKVESGYDVKAKSHKNARGLMQISPTTGEWASRELNISDFTLEKLYDPEKNIMIGCWYLDILRQEFNNDLQLILAAYNGGSGNVTKWLNNKHYSKNGKTLDVIPFKETKDYVDKVMKNYKMYKKIYDEDYFYKENSMLHQTAYVLKTIIE